MTISFGGLATGLDTTSLITQMMELERQPLKQMEVDKAYFNNRLTALNQFEGKLESFLSQIEKLNSATELQAKKTIQGSEDYFSATVDSEGITGSYQVEVVDLAQVQKSVSLGVADKSAHNFGMGTLTLQVGDDDPVDITIDGQNNSLDDIMAAINDADAGVTASIINDGTSNPYRLVLTGAEAATSFSLTSSLATFDGNLSNLEIGGYSDPDAQLFGSGTVSLSTGHDITLSGPNNSLTDLRDAINAETGTTGVSASLTEDGSGGWRLELTGGTIDSTALSGASGYAPPSLADTQNAQQAHIRVDGIDIYSASNTLSEAIPGVTLNLDKAEEGTQTSLTVDLDESAIKDLIKDFISGYNKVVSYVTSQSKSEDGSAGILIGDTGMNSAKRRLQSMLTKPIEGSISSLSMLGMKTQKDGTLELDEDTLTEAIQSDLDGVTTLLAGNESVVGIATQMADYLESITDDIDGLFSSREDTIQSNIKGIEKSIERMEMRLEKREQTLYNQFNALEQLVSSMNSTSSFLTTQLKSLENLWSNQ
ncbi:hypothetical protein A7E78_05600 [Syntrophotalea acetylenivorans]|uniref:Flagellar hook-associated protein 2 n=1 Tax=Syntrophotalea acetylenivorans TaxID=1842532 RepID=A0A1L3GN56_9BACT|nr:flagellar filament capping protein FliD [Syntrophotalea acetylenivorans]APG27362.1 hypothetical protein A7E78_05600 [Syntrophotalea acetylenivorans]